MQIQALLRGSFITGRHKNAIFLKNTLDVRRCFMYTLRHPVTGQPERASERRKCETLSFGRVRQFFIYGLSVAPQRKQRCSATGQPSGWGAGEDKEREGKGRDACRGLREDETPPHVKHIFQKFCIFFAEKLQNIEKSILQKSHFIRRLTNESDMLPW